MRRPSWRTQAAAGLAAIIVAGPAVGQLRHVRSLEELRDEGVIRQRLDLTCGAAALATLLTYQFGRPTGEGEVVRGLLARTSAANVRARLGFSLLELKQYVSRQGLAAAGFDGASLDELEARAPTIVPIRWHGFRHFVVYRGRRGDRVLLADPAFGNRTMSLDAFRQAWAGGILFMVFDPASSQAPNRMGAPAELFLVPGDQTLRARVADVGDGA